MAADGAPGSHSGPAVMSRLYRTDSRPLRAVKSVLCLHFWETSTVSTSPTPAMTA